MITLRIRRVSVLLHLALLVWFGAVVSLRAQPGAFDPDFYRYSVFNQTVFAVALQSDGKVLVGGAFTGVTGVPRNGIARVHGNGRLDASFDPGLGVEGLDAGVYAIQIYSSGIQSGKVVIAGSFTNFNRVARFGIARLNSDGTLDTSFNPGTGIEDGAVYALEIQPDGKIVVGGTFTTVQGTPRSGIARLNSNGTLDNAFSPGSGADGPVYALAVQSNGKIVVGGAFTTMRGATRNGIARLTSDGSLDTLTAFNVGSGAEDGAVYALVLQADGRILLGGDFTSVRGVPRDGLARLQSNGALDMTFADSTGAANIIWAMTALDDGNVLVGGEFTEIGGEFRDGIARLDADGVVDATFDPGLGLSVDHGEHVLAMAVQGDGSVVIGGTFEQVDNFYRPALARLGTDGKVDRRFNQESGTFDAVLASTVQPDGKLLLGGMFTLANGVSRPRVARLNADGLLDETFDPGTGVIGKVNAVAVYTNGSLLGRILIGGTFTTVNDFAVSALARLQANGSVDTNFAPVIVTNEVAALMLQADGKIVIGGAFTNVNGAARNGIARLNPEGSLDASFDPGRGNEGGAVNCVAVQTNGQMVVGGAFTSFDGVTRQGIARLNTNGALDPSFDPGSGVEGGVVRAVAVQPDGRLLIGGSFTTVRAAPRRGLARFNADGTLDGAFNPGDGVSTGGEVRSLALQTNGQILVGGHFTNFSHIVCSGLARLNADGSFDYGFDPGSGVDRAKATVHSLSLQRDGKVVVGGSYLKLDVVDCWNITRLLGGVAVPAPPQVVSWPMSQTALAGENLSFTVKASGSKPLFYQWRRNGVALPGETNTLLQLTAVSTNQSGVYTVAITNSSGVVTSAPTVLTVLSTLDLASVLDAPGLTWTSGGDRIWFGQATVNHDGTDAAQSAPIGNNQRAFLQTSVPGPGRVTFWWKVSSEDGFDFLDFLINDSTQASLTGEVDWVQRSFLVPAGPSTLTWIYSKDAATAGGQDAAWLDQVSYVQAPVLAPATLADGGLQLTIQAASSQRLEIQASTNLTNWTTIGALTNTSSTATFIDATATNFNQRFYRTVTP